MYRILKLLSLFWLATAVRCEHPPNAAEVSGFLAEGTLLSALSSDHLLEAFALVSEDRGRAQNAAGLAVSERLLELWPTLKGRTPDISLLDELQAAVRAELRTRLTAAALKVRACRAAWQPALAW